MAYTVTFTAATLCEGAVREIGDTLSVADDTARMLVDLGVATASGLTPQTGSAAAQFADTFAAKASNLSDLTSAPTARAAIGLGSAALLNTSNVLQSSNNLSDITSAATARTNLELGPSSSAVFATLDESLNGTSSSSLVTPNDLINSQLSHNIFIPYGNVGTAVSGTGASISGSNTYFSFTPPNATIAGYARMAYVVAPYIAGAGISFARYNFVGGWSQYFYFAAAGAAYSGITIRSGIWETGGGVGIAYIDPTARSISWKVDALTGNMDLLVHDGSSLTTVPVKTGITGGQVLKVITRWDGNGNVTCILSDGAGDTTVTTSNGPSTAGVNVNPAYVMQIASTGANSSSTNYYTFLPKHFNKN
jgi:hypothetical protein